MVRRRKWFRPTLRALGRWHQLMGLTAGAFLAFLALTGILLNHTGLLRLNQRYVQANWLLDWYGIKQPGKPVSHAVTGHWVSQVGERLYLDGRELPGVSGPLVGAVEARGMLIVAVEGQLLLFDSAGRLIERVGGQQGVPAGMRAVGLNPQGEFVVRVAHGYYITDRDMLEWRETRAAHARWAVASDTPPALAESLMRAYRGRGLNVERVLLDIHSGRIAGPLGTFVVDVVAVLCLLLAASGAWQWARRKK